MAAQITTKPFLSRRQQRWAFANKKPFAKRWAKETPSFAALPEKKDAGTSLHGPGGLLSTPGMGGRLRKRLKATRITGNLYRGDTGQFQAGGAGTSEPARKPPAASSSTARRRKPAKTEQERTDERQGKQRERDDTRAAQRTQNRADVLRSLNIAPDGAEALDALRRGEQPDAAAIARAGFVDAGLVEQAADGSYRMTPTGRAVLSAADAGDRGRAGDTISGGRDRVMTRRQRQQAAAERKKKPPAQAGSGGGKEKPKIDVAGRMQRINARLARMRKRRGLPVPKPTRQTTKAQTAQDRAMFAKMGGGGKGGGGGSGSGGTSLPGGGLWARNPETGKREPTAKQRKTRNNAIARERQQLERRATRLRPIATLRPKEHGAEMRAIGARMRKLDDMTWNQKSFTVYKSHDGTPRWLARTTTAYRDRDREIIAIKALDQDSQRMTAAGQFGPLRFWHLGRPDPLDAAQPWGPGLDVGDCDFSIQIGTTRVESGTFKSAQLAQRIAQTAAEYELSPGFFHPPNQPSADGVFTDIRTFERSLVPTKYGRASNLFTGLTVKGVRMEPDEMERRFKAAIAQLQLPPDQAAALSAGLIQADKSAQQQGIAYKSDDNGQTITINGVTYKAEAPAYEAPPDVVINGVTYKAMPPFLADKIEGEEKADFGEGEEVGEEIGEADMGMDDAQLVAAIADAVVAKIAPMFGDMKMSELKAMLSGVATKDDSRAQEIAALKAAQTQLEQRIAQLSGDQPAAPLPADVEAALKSTGPTTPNAAPTPANAVQSIAMQTLPQLYQADPSGAWAGWQPTVVPPSQS